MNYPECLELYRLRSETIIALQFGRLRGPAPLLEAMGYSLFAGGKRVRPVLLLATSDLFDQRGHDPAPAAAAIEFIHTYSLIHDDLPAMDNDDLRRGRPTCHRKFGEAAAILAGDALLTEAFTLMTGGGYAAEGPALRASFELASAAGSAGMAGGQMMDIAATGVPIDRAGLEAVHRAKTGMLIRAAVRMGAIIAGASGGELERLTFYAEKIGLAFQIADDVLDVVSTTAGLGKTAGKDSSQGKTTFVDLLGVDGSRSYTQRLVGEACDALAAFKEGAAPLHEMARFIVSRDA
ncbi:MAG: polyprenyl synthetase family protein [Myxococcota bacterium]